LEIKQVSKDILALSKVMISVSVTYTAFAGYIIAGAKSDIKLLALLPGVFVLSSGASAFNHVLERKTDALMGRTSSRPIPAGRLSVRFALTYAVLATLTACLVLLLNFHWMVAMLGICNLLWYNLVYTPLKRTTVWAVFVGTITGVVPFYMGYLAAVLRFPSHEAHFIAFFLLIWQIPHFMLLLGIYGKEYENAGLASFSGKTNPKTLFRTALLWLMACCVSVFSFSVFGFFNQLWTIYLLTILSGLVFLFCLIAFFVNIQKFKIFFVVSNIMQLCIVTGLVLDTLAL
jgi:heme o synthase